MTPRPLQPPPRAQRPTVRVGLFLATLALIFTGAFTAGRASGTPSSQRPDTTHGTTNMNDMGGMP